MATMTPRTLSGFMELLPKPQQQMERMMEILATVLGVCFVALVMLSLCRAAARADAMAQHDWRVFCDEKARKARGQ